MMEMWEEVAFAGEFFVITRRSPVSKAIGPEVRLIPERHQSEYPAVYPSLAALAVTLEQMQLLQPLEYPEWEIDLDAVWVEDLPVEIVRQGFAYE